VSACDVTEALWVHAMSLKHCGCMGCHWGIVGTCDVTEALRVHVMSLRHCGCMWCH